RFDNHTQSAVNLARPERPVAAYQQGLVASLAMRPRIAKLCLIGLGGGDIVRALVRVRPDIVVHSVEIDPAVVAVARTFFLYRESDRVRTTIEDGRAFLTRGGDTYDLIILDAFNSTGVPFHLTTREFFAIARRRLSPDGVLAANFVGNLMGKDGRL